MRKFFAISLLLVHLFNFAGYSVLFNYLIKQSDRQAVQLLDDLNYNEAELVEVRAPLNMPYYTAASGYERINGQIKLNGIQHNYVKRKVANDTLYILCLPNYNTTNLHNAKSDFANKTNELPLNKKSEGSLLKKVTCTGDYNYTSVAYIECASVSQKANNPGYYPSTFSSAYYLTPDEPPEV